MQFVFPEPVLKGRNGIVETFPKQKNQQDALYVTVKTNQGEKSIGLLGAKGTNNEMKKLKWATLPFMAYGSKPIELPFSITLKDFIAAKYPGTENVFSSFESDVTVQDEDKGNFDYNIYMNHVLDHKGYRFFSPVLILMNKGLYLLSTMM